ncbi:unnamed protein product [Ilex paraguariensis]|uniref:Uncharacterized protein n=1 Tax=Ilex paraguariensis TaxID=185542 RepID=A0ABC8QR87_9AQUA
MSAIHVAFEINPATSLVCLSVRSKRSSLVKFMIIKDKREESDKEEAKPARPLPETALSSMDRTTTLSLEEAREGWLTQGLGDGRNATGHSTCRPDGGQSRALTDHIIQGQIMELAWAADDGNPSAACLMRTRLQGRPAAHHGFADVERRAGAADKKTGVEMITSRDVSS